MQERILDTNTLPEPIFRLIKSDKFSYRQEENGDITLLPVRESFSGSGISVQEAKAKLLAELEKGIRSGEEKGWLTADEVETRLGVRDA